MTGFDAVLAKEVDRTFLTLLQSRPTSALGNPSAPLPLHLGRRITGIACGMALGRTSGNLEAASAANEALSANGVAWTLNGWLSSYNGLVQYRCTFAETVQKVALPPSPSPSPVTCHWYHQKATP